MSRRGSLKPLLLVVAAGILAIWLLWSLTYGSVDYVTAKVNRVERVTSNDSSVYLVFTDEETFSNEDSLLFLKFNSSDLHGKFGEGKAYDMKVQGWRVPFLSMYRNVVWMKEVGP